MTITIYSTTICSYCQALTSWLDQHNITYTKKITDQDPAAMAEFMSVNEGNIGVPFTVITDTKGKETKILGFNQSQFSEVLGL